MKEIKALIRPYRLDDVLEAIHAHPDLPGVTVSAVHGFGRTVGRNDSKSVARAQFGRVEMAKLECVVNDEEVNGVVDLIQKTAHTGNAGDGKIFVYDVREAVRIRTGQRLQRIE